MNAVLARLHAQLADETDGKLIRVAQQRAALSEQEYDLRLLSLAHHVRAAYPTAVSIHLQESDQGTNCMFSQWVTMEDGTDTEEYGDHGDAIEAAALGIESYDLTNEVAWTEQGTRSTGSKGDLNLATILENVGGQGR